MAQFTEAQLEQLAKMGFTDPFRGDSVYISSDETDFHGYDQRVWINSGLRNYFGVPGALYRGSKFVADDRLSGDQIEAGLGVGFDCPIAAATWLLLQEANRG